MKVIETNGITNLEQFDTSQEWYWGTNYTSGDLYEAEEIYNSGKRFEPNRLIFVHYPDGTVFEPIGAKENQYFGRPACIEGVIYILLVKFDEKVIQLFQCSDDMRDISVKTEIPLNEVKDCYNLGIDGNPVMITRQGYKEDFQVIWPEQVAFEIGRRECFICREADKLFFSEWSEDTDYREWVNIRDYASGNLLEKIDGTVFSLPNNEHWIIR